jgi:hypothetical protein
MNQLPLDGVFAICSFLSTENEISTFLTVNKHYYSLTCQSGYFRHLFTLFVERRLKQLELKQLEEEQQLLTSDSRPKKNRKQRVLTSSVIRQAIQAERQQLKRIQNMKEKESSQRFYLAFKQYMRRSDLRERKYCIIDLLTRILRMNNSEAMSLLNKKWVEVIHCLLEDPVEKDTSLRSLSENTNLKFNRELATSLYSCHNQTGILLYIFFRSIQKTKYQYKPPQPIIQIGELLIRAFGEVTSDMNKLEKDENSKTCLTVHTKEKLTPYHLLLKSENIDTVKYFTKKYKEELNQVKWIVKLNIHEYSKRIMYSPLNTVMLDIEKLKYLLSTDIDWKLNEEQYLTHKNGSIGSLLHCASDFQIIKYLFGLCEEKTGTFRFDHTVLLKNMQGEIVRATKYPNGINAIDYHLPQLLLKSTRSDIVQFISILIKRGFNINAVIPTEGANLLYIATKQLVLLQEQKKRAPMYVLIKELLELGADPNIVNETSNHSAYTWVQETMLNNEQFVDSDGTLVTKKKLLELFEEYGTK